MQLKRICFAKVCSYLAFSCLLILLVSCAGPKARNASCLLAIERLPGKSIYALTYRCKDMVRCVNTLRHAGKTAAFQALQEYTLSDQAFRDPLQEEKLIYVCNILFVNPEGWSRLGGEPETDETIAKSFPLFPVAMSDGVPFILIEGYVIGGFTGISGTGQVRKCFGLQTIDHDLSTTGFKKAAEDLVESGSFQRLYKNPRDRERMAEEILHQAD